MTQLYMTRADQRVLGDDGLPGLPAPCYFNISATGGMGKTAVLWP